MKPHQDTELSRKLLEITIIRAMVLLLGLNFADRLGILPANFGPFPFLWAFNILALTFTVACLLALRISRHKKLQLFIQIGADLILTTVLVTCTHGNESAFISLYLLIIIYCSLTLGRNGGMAGAALSTILYAGVVAAGYMGLFDSGSRDFNTPQAAFRISVHALGFWAVAYLGTYLHQRLQAMECALNEKIDSLKELQRLNEHIVASIRSGLITIDLRGHIAVFNNAAGELTGRRSEEMLGKPIHIIIGEAFWNRIIGTDLFSTARPLRHEEWLTLPDGRRRYLGFSVSPLLDELQHLIGYIMSFQDLTDINRLEEALRLKDRMATVGRMAAGIAHEIRNPLMAMRGSVEVLRSHLNVTNSDERLLDILVRESERLNGFVEDFLNYARPRRYEQSSIDVVPVLRDSVTLLKNSPEVSNRHSIILNIEARSIPIIGSAEQLSQVFWNLAQNAIRAMPGGGELRISLRQSFPNSGEIVFEDSGVGMTASEREQLFQPFHSGFGYGLGLGLSIVFQIVDDHRGKISFDSEKGNGTRVRLEFPLEEQHAVQVENAIA